LSDDAAVILIEPLPPKQTSTLRKIIIGKDGLRAGWSLLIFIAILVMIGYSVNKIGHKLYPPTPKSAQATQDAMGKPSFLLIGELSQLLVVVLVTWIMSKIERRRNSVYGFGGARKMSHFLAGLAWGITCLSLLVLTLWKTGLLVIESRVLFGSDILLRSHLAGRLPAGWTVRGVPDPRLSPVHAHPRPGGHLPVGFQDAA
jgi:hypothetical protein